MSNLENFGTLLESVRNFTDLLGLIENTFPGKLRLETGHYCPVELQNGVCTELLNARTLDRFYLSASQDIRQELQEHISNNDNVAATELFEDTCVIPNVELAFAANTKDKFENLKHAVIGMNKTLQQEAAEIREMNERSIYYHETRINANIEREIQKCDETNRSINGKTAKLMKAMETKLRSQLQQSLNKQNAMETKLGSQLKQLHSMVNNIVNRDDVINSLKSENSKLKRKLISLLKSQINYLCFQLDDYRESFCSENSRLFKNAQEKFKEMVQYTPVPADQLLSNLESLKSQSIADAIKREEEYEEDDEDGVWSTEHNMLSRLDEDVDHLIKSLPLYDI